MKRLIPLMLFGFAVALAIVIGQRMSTDAMAVIVGVAVGVAASVPTSLLLIALLRKERQSFREDPRGDFKPYPPALPNSQPNVIVIDPSQYAGQRYQNGYPLPAPDNATTGGPNGGVRKLRVIGSDDERDWQ